MTEKLWPPTDPRLDALVRFYETLSPQRLDNIAKVYAEQARFIDPFNNVVGHEAIRRIFADMFEKLTEPRFIVTGRYLSEENTNQAMLLWQLRFKSRMMGPGEQSIEGSTRLVFDEAGRVTLHRDYWDAAAELYAKIPLLKIPIRLLARRLAVK